MAYNKIVLGTGETLIDLSNDTVEESSVLSGYIYHDRSGVQKTGTNTYTVDASEADALASEILAGKTAAVGNSIVTGTMPNRGAVSGVISERDGEYVVPQGAHDGSGKVAISATERAKIIGANIKQGVTILGVVGTHEGGESVTTQTKTVTPSFTAQTILPDTEYDYLSQVTVNPISVTYTNNAAGGQTVTIG